MFPCSGQEEDLSGLPAVEFATVGRWRQFMPLRYGNTEVECSGGNAPKYSPPGTIG